MSANQKPVKFTGTISESADGFSVSLHFDDGKTFELFATHQEAGEALAKWAAVAGGLRQTAQ